MKVHFKPFMTGFLFLCFVAPVLAVDNPKPPKNERTVAIPLGGNAFHTKGERTTRIADKGLSNWSDISTVTSVYFRTEESGLLQLALRLKVPDGKSRIKVSINKRSFEKEISSSSYDTLKIGAIKADPGYVKVDLQGISKTGSSFAEVSDLIIEGDSSLVGKLVFVKENTQGNFHFGRRGPSVHLKFDIPETEKEKVEWFYNEITVPTGQDVIGSYYMANGFNGGYFGMQVNSPTERRVLFSIWSPYQTDDPGSIPDSLKIRLLKKGENVNTGEFGNEGSGGQSFLRYAWKAGVTYAFLTRAVPNQARNTTVFTSYFKDPEVGNWKLIASFERPKTNTYLKGLYSFLENFRPETGHIERRVNFGNQWVISKKGTWTEITAFTLTADNTARKNYRKDYAGGTNGETFYLRNCGFFNDFVPTNQTFTRKSTAKSKPEINFDQLP